MRRWWTIVGALAALGLAATTERWWPPLGAFLLSESDRIQALADLIQIAIWTVALVLLGVGAWRLRRPRKEERLAQEVRGNQAAAVAGNVETGGGESVGRDVRSVRGGDASGPGSISVTGPARFGDLHIHAGPERTSPAEPNLAQLRREYLDGLYKEHQYLSMKGFGVADRVSLRLPLIDLYVPSEARREVPQGGTLRREEALQLAGREVTGEKERRLAERLQGPEPVLELLAAPETQGLILLGDPGAGKTTFLKYLVLQLARGEGSDLGLGDRLPILVPLSGYATALAQEEVALEAYVGSYISDDGSATERSALVSEALARGEALLLLDGLDEVKDSALRSTVVERVRRFFIAQGARGNKLVITSRVVGYHESRPAPTEGLVECTLVDFGDEEIQAFARGWTDAVESQAYDDPSLAQREARREYRELLEAIRLNPGVRRLAANPLLLTILAVMKRQDVVLPERRVQLYQRYVETLLSTWNRARGLGRPYTSDLDPVHTERVLADVALWMHRENPGLGLAKEADLRRHLEGLFAAAGEPDPESVARRFLGDVGKESGLLLERGTGTYGFIHLTFEEYLAAVGLYRESDGEVRRLIPELLAKVGVPAWREVTLLSVAHLGIVQGLEKKAGRVVEALVEARAGAPGEAVVLAGEAVLDAGESGVAKASRGKVVERLVETMQAGEVDARLRRQAGLLLGNLGWVPEDLDELIRIPPGEFLYGDDRQTRRIDRPFWISKYPVTNRQFGRFIEDRGYEREDLWSSAGWSWRKQENRLQPGFWEDRIWNRPIFPVVGVTWFEAEAYGNWLQTRPDLCQGLPDGLPEGYRLGLPTEEQWERAARGTDGREYPWGDEFQAENANTLESFSEDQYGTFPTAVATYVGGVGPEGLWDASGNVWEWTTSKFEDEGSRVVRGGSWVDGQRFARCAARNRIRPSYFGDSFGFRCGAFPG